MLVCATTHSARHLGHRLPPPPRPAMPPTKVKVHDFRTHPQVRGIYQHTKTTQFRLYLKDEDVITNLRELLVNKAATPSVAIIPERVDPPGEKPVKGVGIHVQPEDDVSYAERMAVTNELFFFVNICRRRPTVEEVETPSDEVVSMQRAYDANLESFKRKMPGTTWKTYLDEAVDENTLKFLYGHPYGELKFPLLTEAARNKAEEEWKRRFGERLTVTSRIETNEEYLRRQQRNEQTLIDMRREDIRQRRLSLATNMNTYMKKRTSETDEQYEARTGPKQGRPILAAHANDAEKETYVNACRKWFKELQEVSTVKYARSIGDIMLIKNLLLDESKVEDPDALQRKRKEMSRRLFDLVLEESDDAFARRKSDYARKKQKYETYLRDMASYRELVDARAKHAYPPPPEPSLSYLIATRTRLSAARASASDDATKQAIGREIAAILQKMRDPSRRYEGIKMDLDRLNAKREIGKVLSEPEEESLAQLELQLLDLEKVSVDKVRTKLSDREFDLVGVSIMDSVNVRSIYVQPIFAYQALMEWRKYRDSINEYARKCYRESETTVVRDAIENGTYLIMCEPETKTTFWIPERVYYERSNAPLSMRSTTFHVTHGAGYKTFATASDILMSATASLHGDVCTFSFTNYVVQKEPWVAFQKALVNYGSDAKEENAGSGSRKNNSQTKEDDADSSLSALSNSDDTSSTSSEAAEEEEEEEDPLVVPPPANDPNHEEAADEGAPAPATAFKWIGRYYLAVQEEDSDSESEQEGMELDSVDESESGMEEEAVEAEEREEGAGKLKQRQFKKATEPSRPALVVAGNEEFDRTMSELTRRSTVPEAADARINVEEYAWLFDVDENDDVHDTLLASMVPHEREGKKQKFTYGRFKPSGRVLGSNVEPLMNSIWRPPVSSRDRYSKERRTREFLILYAKKDESEALHAESDEAVAADDSPAYLHAMDKETGRIFFDVPTSLRINIKLGEGEQRPSSVGALLYDDNGLRVTRCAGFEVGMVLYAKRATSAVICVKVLSIEMGYGLAEVVTLQDIDSGVRHMVEVECNAMKPSTAAAARYTYRPVGSTQPFLDGLTMVRLTRAYRRLHAHLNFRKCLLRTSSDFFESRSQKEEYFAAINQATKHLERDFMNRHGCLRRGRCPTGEATVEGAEPSPASVLACFRPPDDAAAGGSAPFSHFDILAARLEGTHANEWINMPERMTDEELVETLVAQRERVDEAAAMKRLLRTYQSTLADLAAKRQLAAYGAIDLRPRAQTQVNELQNQLEELLRTYLELRVDTTENDLRAIEQVDVDRQKRKLASMVMAVESQTGVEPSGADDDLLDYCVAKVRLVDEARTTVPNLLDTWNNNKDSKNAANQNVAREAYMKLLFFVNAVPTALDAMGDRRESYLAFKADRLVIDSVENFVNASGDQEKEEAETDLADVVNSSGASFFGKLLDIELDAKDRKRVNKLLNDRFANDHAKRFLVAPNEEVDDEVRLACDELDARWTAAYAAERDAAEVELREQRVRDGLQQPFQFAIANDDDELMDELEQRSNDSKRRAEEARETARTKREEAEDSLASVLQLVDGWGTKHIVALSMLTYLTVSEMWVHLQVAAMHRRNRAARNEDRDGHEWMLENHLEPDELDVLRRVVAHRREILTFRQSEGFTSLLGAIEVVVARQSNDPNARVGSVLLQNPLRDVKMLHGSLMFGKNEYTQLLPIVLSQPQLDVVTMAMEHANDNLAERLKVVEYRDELYASVNQLSATLLEELRTGVRDDVQHRNRFIEIVTLLCSHGVVVDGVQHPLLTEVGSRVVEEFFLMEWDFDDDEGIVDTPAYVVLCQTLTTFRVTVEEFGQQVLTVVGAMPDNAIRNGKSKETWSDIVGKVVRVLSMHKIISGLVGGDLSDELRASLSREYAYFASLPSLPAPTGMEDAEPTPSGEQQAPFPPGDAASSTGQLVRIANVGDAPQKRLRTDAASSVGSTGDDESEESEPSDDEGGNDFVFSVAFDHGSVREAMVAAQIDEAMMYLVEHADGIPALKFNKEEYTENRVKLSEHDKKKKFYAVIGLLGRNASAIKALHVQKFKEEPHTDAEKIEFVRHLPAAVYTEVEKANVEQYLTRGGTFSTKVNLPKGTADCVTELGKRLKQSVVHFLLEAIWGAGLRDATNRDDVAIYALRRFAWWYCRNTDTAENLMTSIISAVREWARAP